MHHGPVTLTAAHLDPSTQQQQQQQQAQAISIQAQAPAVPAQPSSSRPTSSPSTPLGEPTEPPAKPTSQQAALREQQQQQQQQQLREAVSQQARLSNSGLVEALVQGGGVAGDSGGSGNVSGGISIPTGVAADAGTTPSSGSQRHLPALTVTVAAPSTCRTLDRHPFDSRMHAYTETMHGPWLRVSLYEAGCSAVAYIPVCLLTDFQGLTQADTEMQP